MGSTHITSIIGWLQSWCKYRKNRKKIHTLYRWFEFIHIHHLIFTALFFHRIMWSIYPYAWDVVLRTASLNSLQPTKTERYSIFMFLFYSFMLFMYICIKERDTTHNETERERFSEWKSARVCVCMCGRIEKMYASSFSIFVRPYTMCTGCTWLYYVLKTRSSPTENVMCVWFSWTLHFSSGSFAIAKMDIYIMGKKGWVIIVIRARIKDSFGAFFHHSLSPIRKWRIHRARDTYIQFIRYFCVYIARTLFILYI